MSVSACEKCWADAHVGYPYASVAEEYGRLIDSRPPCSPEEQAGPDAKPCEECGGRKVRHQHTGECMAGHGFPVPIACGEPPSGRLRDGR